MDDIFLDGMCSGRSQSPSVEHAVIDGWTALLVALFSKKGLYQNVSLDPELFERFADEEYSARQLKDEFASRPIFPYSRGDGDDKQSIGRTGPCGVAGIGTPQAETPLSFYLPNVPLECPNCRADSTFLSMTCSANCFVSPYPLRGPATEQVFHPYYRCATCRKAYIVFQVVRRGTKAQLTGRSRAYRPKLDPIWPGSISEVIRDAICANTENDVAAAYYHLRTAIEIYAKDELNMPVSQKIDGTKLCEEYNATLDIQLKREFPCIATLYSDLSAGLHSRHVDSSPFSQMMDAFADHLRAKALFGKYSGKAT